MLVYSDLPFADPVAFGDALADYIEDGGGVVFAAGAFASGSAIEGRVASSYLPVTVGTLATTAPTLATLPQFAQQLGYPPVSGHPVMYSVDDVEGGPYVQGLTEIAGAVRIAEWSDGEPAVVLYETPDSAHGDVIAVNLFPPSSDADAAYWTGHGDRLLTNALLWSAGFEKPATTSYNTTIFQDYNCNGLDVSVELPVDLTDPVCLANVDPVTGAPDPNNDWYYDYYTHGCEAFVDPAMDLDGDQLIGDRIYPYMFVVVVGEAPLTLLCDNCTVDFNPDQADMDLDGIGDPCDTCVFVPNHDQDFDMPCDDDCFGNACDNCPCDPNNDQSDLDDDGAGDVCDVCPEIPDPDQIDLDGDLYGDLCDNCPAYHNPL